jgi:hypothetical protein
VDERVLAEETSAVRGAIFEVYREMGSGFLESVYEGWHEAQLMNYLKATGMKRALLVNFGSYPSAEVERKIL